MIDLWFCQVIRLEASHTDSSLSHRISYTMDGDANNNLSPFFLDPDTGVIRVSDSSKLNYEEVQRYRITVIANSGT